MEDAGADGRKVESLVVTGKNASFEMTAICFGTIYSSFNVDDDFAK